MTRVAALQPELSGYPFVDDKPLARARSFSFAGKILKLGVPGAQLLWVAITIHCEQPIEWLDQLA